MTFIFSICHVSYSTYNYNPPCHCLCAIYVKFINNNNKPVAFTSICRFKLVEILCAKCASSSSNYDNAPTNDIQQKEMTG